jgi:ATP-dependent DNA ligase
MLIYPVMHISCKASGLFEALLCAALNQEEKRFETFTKVGPDSRMRMLKKLTACFQSTVYRISRKMS